MNANDLLEVLNNRVPLATSNITVLHEVIWFDMLKGWIPGRDSGITPVDMSMTGLASYGPEGLLNRWQYRR